MVLRATHLYLEGPLQGGGGSGGGGARGGSSDDDDDYEMVAGGSGAVEDLPAHTRAVVAALGSEQRDLDAAVSRYRAARAAAAEGVNAKLKALYAKRRAALAAAGAAGNAPPRYWLRVLRSVDAAALAITRRDAAVLQHLVDVRYEVRAPEGGASSGSSTGGGEQQVHAALELEFSDACPQLAPRARTLRKEYRFTVLGAGAAASGGPALRLLSSKVAVAPEWAPGTRDPTHRKARDGRLRPAASVFQLFRAQGGGGKWAFNLTGPEKEVQVRPRWRGARCGAGRGRAWRRGRLDACQSLGLARNRACCTRDVSRMGTQQLSNGIALGTWVLDLGRSSARTRTNA